MAQYPRVQPINDNNTRHAEREVATLLAGEVVGVEGLSTAVALTKVVDTPVPSGLGATSC
jgi:hypothetical protein